MIERLTVQGEVSNMVTCDFVSSETFLEVDWPKEKCLN